MKTAHQNIHAILIVCMGWLSFSVADTCAKYLVQHYDPSLILVTNGTIGAMVAFLWLMRTGGLSAFRTPKLKWHIVRAFLTIGTSYSVVNALAHLPIADFYGITFMSPFLIALFSFLLLGENVGWRRVGAMMVAFAGVIILAGPQYETHNTGLLWALLVPVFQAFNVLCVRKLGHSDPLALFALFPFIGIMLFNGAIVGGDYTLPDTNHLWIFALAACSIMGGLIGTSMGFAKASESSVVAPFLYTQIIWGVIIGMVLFSTVPTSATLIGAALIIGAGLYSLYREYRADKSGG